MYSNEYVKVINVTFAVTAEEGRAQRQFNF